MTGHHGWGYGQNDGRHRSSRPHPLGLAPDPPTQRDLQALSSRRGRDPSPSSPQSPAHRRVRALAPRHLAQSARGSPSGPAASKPPARPSASCLLLRAAPDDRRWDLGRTLTHSSPRWSAQRVEVAQGSWGRAERSAARHAACGERARLVCSDLPGAGLRMGKGAVSPAGFARRKVSKLSESAGM